MNERAPKVLIADDEPDILVLYKTKFEKAGFTVFVATDGLEAISVARSEHPDLILMDVKMPELDGISAQKAIYEGLNTRNIPVVFLTAFSDPAAQDLEDNFGKEPGVVGIIRKGGDLNELVSQVRGLIGKTA